MFFEKNLFCVSWLLFFRVIKTYKSKLSVLKKLATKITLDVDRQSLQSATQFGSGKLRIKLFLKSVMTKSLR